LFDFISDARSLDRTTQSLRLNQDLQRVARERSVAPACRTNSPIKLSSACLFGVRRPSEDIDFNEFYLRAAAITDVSPDFRVCFA